MSAPPKTARKLALLATRIEKCRACPRLVRWREEVARVKRRAYRDWTYHGRPVAGFGDPRARIAIVGLAPGAHGANRTGRAFTGDKSGDFLYAALHRAGIANQPTSTSQGDGLELRGAFVTLAARCVPPENKPTRRELANCAHWLDEELALLPAARVHLALGAIAFDAVVARARRLGDLGPRAKFAHGAEVALGDAGVLVASYHVSQQNTQTGRLTPAMFDAVLRRAKDLAGLTSSSGRRASRASRA
jgi:uracil-DNA glycosylase family 4